MRRLRAGGLHRPGIRREVVRGRGRSEVPAGRRAGRARRGASSGGTGPRPPSTRLLQPQNSRRSFFTSPTCKATKRLLTSSGRSRSDGQEATQIFIGMPTCPDPARCLWRLEASRAPRLLPCVQAAPGPSCPCPGGTFSEVVLRKITSPPPKRELKNRAAGPDSLQRRLQRKPRQTANIHLNVTVPQFPTLCPTHLLLGNTLAQGPCALAFPLWLQGRGLWKEGCMCGGA